MDIEYYEKILKTFGLSQQLSRKHRSIDIQVFHYGWKRIQWLVLSPRSLFCRPLALHAIRKVVINSQRKWCIRVAFSLKKDKTEYGRSILMCWQWFWGPGKLYRIVSHYLHPTHHNMAYAKTGLSTKASAIKWLLFLIRANIFHRRNMVQNFDFWWKA